MTQSKRRVRRVLSGLQYNSTTGGQGWGSFAGDHSIWKIPLENKLMQLCKYPEKNHQKPISLANKIKICILSQIDE